MIIYEDENVIVKPSVIEGYGLFAKRLFKSGETILRWNPTKLNKEELLSISQDQKRYVNKLSNGVSVLMNIPERYINSSDTPNVRSTDDGDIAIKDIQIGEEITTNYNL